MKRLSASINCADTPYKQTKTHIPMKSRIFLFIALLAMVACQPKDPVERQIDDLLSQMTLEEKIAQMTQVCGGQISDNIAEQIRNGAGSMLNSVGAEADYYQRIAVEESRLGIPMIFARDVIHGFRTIFPIPLGQAATLGERQACHPTSVPLRLRG